ncbi:MAG: LysR substrate-binding domain-containing protein [Burkholderiaceae bacterium]|nr:LysR substrate-binding domain-containing protein [Burkholderiaceae bacterium]
MKPTINMRQVEAFRAVMLAGTVVGAAKLLNVTQPGVSRTLGLLELRLGYALFERRGRRLYPTAEAEALYREVEQIYIGIERIGQVAQDIRYQRAGALRVATMPALAQWLVPTAISRFLADRPNVTAFVQSLPSRQIAEQVSTRQFDVGVVELPLTRPAIQIEPLEPVPTVAVMHAAHPLAAQSSISLKDLHGERMVLLSQHSYVRYQIDDAFSRLGVSPNVVIETPSSSIATALVAAGAGITLVSRWTAEPFASPSLAVRDVRETLASRYAFIYPEGISPGSLARAFAAELLALTREPTDC